MNYNVLCIHPSDKEHAADIGEEVFKLNGVMQEKTILGVFFYTATFADQDGARAALHILEELDYVSFVCYAKPE